MVDGLGLGRALLHLHERNEVPAKPGYDMPHCSACMPPIETPKIAAVAPLPVDRKQATFNVLDTTTVASPRMEATSPIPVYVAHEI